jgi:hypothetical protein
MRGIIITIGIFFAFFLLDKLGLWMERKGWLYYRHRKPESGSILGNSLQELNALLSPSGRHVIEVKQNKAVYKKSEADTPSEPLDDKDEKTD